MIFTYKQILLLLSLTICRTFLAIAQEGSGDTIKCKTPNMQNVAYGTLSKDLVIGSSSVVDGDKLRKSFSTNLSNALNGWLPGLTIQQSNSEPGEDTPDMYSRGVSTLYTNDILIIVDGFESTIENLVPEEIETITLLKDAAATVLYGGKAANGVLLVTTKRGTNSPLKISFSACEGIQYASNLPDFLGSYDYARLYNEALENDGKAPIYTDSDLEAYKSGSDPYLHPNVDWYDEVLRKAAPIGNYDLNLTGGSETVQYFVLFNILSSGGLYKKTGDQSDNSINSTYKRYNFRTNVDINVLKNLKAIINVAGSIENKNNPFQYSTDSIFGNMAKIAPNAFPVYNPNGSWGGNNIYSNPLGDITETGFIELNSRTLQTTVKLIQNLDFITKGLSISGALSFNNYFQGHSSKTREYTRYSIYKNDAGETIYNTIGENTSLEGYDETDEQWYKISKQLLLNYQRTFNNNEIDALLLFATDKHKIGNATALTSFPYRHNYFGGRFTIANKKKYIGELSFGVSGSENFPENNRYGFFPAVSLGWIISNEDFLKESEWLNYLKVKGSYGLVGNDEIGEERFIFNSTYAYGDYYYLGTSNTAVGSIAEAIYSNPNLTWEKSKIFNFGFEATILKNVGFGVDIFNEERYDILAKPYATVPEYLGINLPYLNVGKVNNKGLEVKLSYSKKCKNDFQYSIEGNAWYSKNELTYFSEAPQLYDYLYTEGSPVSQPFGYEAIGLFKDQADINSSPVQSFSANVQPGDIKYKDLNSDGVINQLDKHAIGNTDVPKFNAALYTTFKYKGFDLSLQFHGVMGRSVYLEGDYYEAFQNDGKIGAIALNRWTTTNAGSADYPRLSSENNQNNFGVYSSFWQKNGNYLKLRSFELGYSLPNNTIAKLGLSGMRIFINGTNLFSLDHLKYSDPEIIEGYPALRTFSVGLKVEL